MSLELKAGSLTSDEPATAVKPWRCTQVLLEREPELGGNAPILGACPLDESLVVVGVDKRRDRDSLLGSHS